MEKPNTIDFILDKSILKIVENHSLFYPCSGNDFKTPIEIFTPYITDFWFVDRGYFSPNNCDTRHFGLDAPADKQRPLLENDTRYAFEGKKIIGPPSWHRSDKNIEPCILTENYRHKESNKEIRIHRRRGYGFSAFELEDIGKLGVFFYRGDGPYGEGGSGNLWLRYDHRTKVIKKLIDGGFLVIDGSDGAAYRRRNGIFKKLCKYTHPRMKIEKTPEELVKEMGELVDETCNGHFCCVGYAGMKYGPTFIWQVWKMNRADDAG